MNDYYLGIDFGTSGARAIVINNEKKITHTISSNFPNNEKINLIKNWRDTLHYLLDNIPIEQKQNLRSIAINGTSSTVLLCDKIGEPLDEPILYNDSRGKIFLDKIKNIAPKNSVVISATSSLAKLLYWQETPIFKRAKYFLHQADWLSFLLHGKLGISDYHNALKLGYDVETLTYPNWLQKLGTTHLLPKILAPGEIIENVSKKISDRFSISPNCLVSTGTTDSIAAFLASGANKPGEAVTSLGSTLVLKLLSKQKIENSKYGIYSHKLGKLWLTGGASNTGGAVLKYYFTDKELQELSLKINPQIPNNLQYYPLLKAGERFPINNPKLEPKLSPRPSDRVKFLYGLLDSIARIENQGYQKLKKLGATKLNLVYTAGGGAKNITWSKIRECHLKVPISSNIHTDAAYGTALLALQSI